MSKKITILDGSMGTQLQLNGLRPGETPEDWNVDHPEIVTAIHQAYLAAGAEVIYTNTFGANAAKYRGKYSGPEVTLAAIALARSAAGRERKVALDVGPTGRLLKPAGDCDFEVAYEAFAEQVKAGEGADLIVIETMTDLREMKAAVLAAKENSQLPIYATVALQADGTLLTGGTVETFAVLMEGLGVDAYGFNCGLGPDLMLPFVQRIARVSTKPIVVKANAGLPKVVDGKTVFAVGAKEFADKMQALVEAGATIVGGCCGTTPAHIGEIKRAQVQERSFSGSGRTEVCSGTSVVELRPYAGVIIGERINPTGKKLLKEAFRKGDTAYVLREAVKQTEAGAEILDVNCGVPGIDEPTTLEATIESVQSVASCPLQIDTADPAALKRALRRVNGKPLVNSVNGKRESMDAVFPLVRETGGVIVALCLDEEGIPATVEGRLAIARKILDEGAKYGFRKEDFVFDALTLAVSAEALAAKVTLETVRRLTEELKVNTVLGVSNVSFGLPNRPTLNNTMYALAKRAGLSAAIANPSAIRDEIDPAAEAVLMGLDEGCQKWIALNQAVAAVDTTPIERTDSIGEIAAAIRHGLKADAEQAAARAVAETEALEVIERGIVPALEEVGKGFESGRLFLPQLLMAADAAGAAFGAVRAALAVSGQEPTGKGPIVIATVKGDIHDIGKNIVRALLENYGFSVIDLGRDVAPEEIVRVAVANQCRLVGLSALMTTTVKSMEQSVRLLAQADPSIKTFVGGAVVTAEYAKEIGATYYTKDAMASVRLAERFFAEIRN